MSERFPQPTPTVLPKIRTNLSIEKMAEKVLLSHCNNGGGITPEINFEGSFTTTSDEEIAEALKLAKLRLGLPTINTKSPIEKIIEEARTYGNEGTCNNDDTYNDSINFGN